MLEKMKFAFRAVRMGSLVMLAGYLQRSPMMQILAGDSDMLVEYHIKKTGKGIAAKEKKD